MIQKRSKRGGAREGAVRPSLYPNKKSVLLLLTEENNNRLTRYAKECGLSKSDCINSILDDAFKKES